MAKKKAPAKSKGSSKSSKDSGSNSGIILAVIMVLVIGAAWYLKNNGGLPSFVMPGAKQEQSSSLEDSNTQTPTLRKDAQRTEVEEKPSENSQSTEPKENNESKKDTQAKAEDAKEPTDYNKYYYTTSFDFAWPAYSQDDQIVEHEGYTLAYSEPIEQAKWVAYRLTAANLNKKVAKRQDNFEEDPDVRSGSATLNDYKASGYDRGHLAPAADFAWSQLAMDGTFYLSNISPQVPDFNSGIWNRLEEKVRVWGAKNKELFIVTGPIVEKGAKKIGRSKVSVPQKYYKVILDISEPEIKAIGFILKNEASEKNFMEFAVTIDVVEKETGLDFFPMVPDDLEKKLESSINKNLWK